MQSIAEAYWTADTHHDGLTAVARILQARNPHLSMFVGVLYADEIADALHACENDKALEALNRAIAYRKEPWQLRTF